MDLVQELCEVENELSALVYIKQTWGLSFTVAMRESRCNGRGDELLQKLSSTLSEYIQSARRDADEDAFRKTEAFIRIAKAILIAPMEASTKIALYSKFNIMGYMFDRTAKNYLACHYILQDFLEALDDFTKRLEPDERIAWNNSTYGGEAQVLRFSGLLDGIYYAASQLGHEELINPYKNLESLDPSDTTVSEKSLSIDGIIRDIETLPKCSVKEKRELLCKGESIATDSYDYLMLGLCASDNSILNDKSWGRLLFHKSLLKAISNINAQINRGEDPINASEIFDLALAVTDPSHLGDKTWAKELFELAVKNDTIVSNLNSMACSVANVNILNDRAFARLILTKAWDVFSNGIDDCLFEEIVMTCGYLAHDDIGNDKQQAELWLKELQLKISNPIDYVHLGKCWGHDNTMNNKEYARHFFEKALCEPREMGNPAAELCLLPYYEVALEAFSPNVLNDPDWAADICEKHFRHIDDRNDLIGMSSIAFQKSERLARIILEYLENMLNDDEYSTSNDYVFLASHISNKSLHPRPMFEDKAWGRRLFEKALLKAESINEKDEIHEAMKKHL